MILFLTLSAPLYPTHPRHHLATIDQIRPSGCYPLFIVCYGGGGGGSFRLGLPVGFFADRSDPFLAAASASASAFIFLISLILSACCASLSAFSSSVSYFSGDRSIVDLPRDLLTGDANGSTGSSSSESESAAAAPAAAAPAAAAPPPIRRRGHDPADQGVVGRLRRGDFLRGEPSPGIPIGVGPLYTSISPATATLGGTSTIVWTT